MRRAAIILCLAGTLALGTLPAAGQTPGGEASITLQPSPANRLAVVRITLRDHKLVEGRLLGLTDSGIVIRTGGKNRTFDKDEILSVRIVKEAETLKSLFTGALLTIFYGAVPMLFINPGDSTPFFSESQSLEGSLLTTALQGGSGMIMASIVSAVSSPARRRGKSFGDPGEAGLTAREWESLRSFTAGGATTRPPKLHLTADIGWTLGKAVEGTLAGLSSEPVNWEKSKFNRLRRLRLEYDVGHSLSLGAAYAWLGEPSAYSYDYENWSSPSTWARVSRDSRGYFLTLAFHPFKRERSGSGWDWAAGVGAGAARLILHVTEDYSYDPELGIDIVSKTVPSFMAYASAGYRLSRGLSVGISADWTWMPDQKTVAVPWAASETRRIAFSSGCIGFYLGLHF
jgi:hypothetical protein